MKKVIKNDELRLFKTTNKKQPKTERNTIMKKLFLLVILMMSLGMMWGQLRQDQNLAPRNVVATCTNNRVTLTWSQPNVILYSGGGLFYGYRIWRTTYPDIYNFEAIGLVTNNVFSYLDNTAVNGVTYTYIVAAFHNGNPQPNNTGGNGGDWYWGTLTTTPPNGRNPVGTVTHQVWPNHIHLSWNKAEHNATANPSAGTGQQYRVYRSVDGGAYTMIQTVAWSRDWLWINDPESYETQSLTTGVTYRYYVVANYSTGESIPSNIITHTFNSDCRTINANPIGTDISVSWGNPSGFAQMHSSVMASATYKLYRRTGLDGDWQMLYSGTATNWTDTGAMRNTVYYYNAAVVYSGGRESVKETITPPVFIKDETVMDVITGASNSTYFSRECFIDFGYADSITQNLYLASDLRTAGTIYQMSVKFRYTGGLYPTPGGYNLKIYMANTTKATYSSTADWVPFEDFTLVYAGNPRNLGPAVINAVRTVDYPLDSPFEYTGGNLAVMVVKDHGGAAAPDLRFLWTAEQSQNRTLHWRSNDAGAPPVDPLPATATNMWAGFTNADFYIFPESYTPMVYVGNPHSTTTAREFPFYYLNNNHLVQTIYLADDLQVENGTIQSIIYRKDGSQDIPANQPVSVYIAHTDLDAFPDNTSWVSLEDFTKVYEGNLPASGAVSREVPITFNVEPFIYNGGNIVVMTRRHHINTTFNQNFAWRNTAVGANRTLYLNSNITNLEFESNWAAGALSSSVANTIFRFNSMSVFNSPRQPEASQRYGSVYVNWTVPEASDDPDFAFSLYQYEIFRAGWTAPLFLPITETGILDPNVPVGTYEYNIYAHYISLDDQGNISQRARSAAATVIIIVETEEDQDVPPDQLPPPTHVRATVEGRNVTLEWEKPLSAFPDAYMIVQNNEVLENRITPLARSFTLNNLDAGDYNFMVVAFYEYTMETSNEYSTSVDQTYTPSIVTHSTDFSTSIEVVAGYSGFATLTVGAGVSFGTSESVTPGYWTETFGMSESTGIGFSRGPFYIYSTQIGVNVPQDPPPAPRNFNTSHPINDDGYTSSSVTLYWDAPILPEVGTLRGYKVYRDGVEITSGQASGFIPNTTQYYTDYASTNGLIAGNAYTYYVTAIYEGTEIPESQPSRLLSIIPVGGTRPANWNSPDAGRYPDTAYEIANVANLRWLSEWNRLRSDVPGNGSAGGGWWWNDNPDALVYFKQTADIDASEWFNDYRPFRPIGHNVSPTDNRFRGVYDGQGHTISNLYINTETRGMYPTGLFSSISGTGSAIKNLHLVNATIRGNMIAGGIVGEIHNGAVIENCSFSGNISAYSAAGGIAGMAYNNSFIRTSYTFGNIIAHNAGGIVGTITASEIKNSFSRANVRGSYIGGIAGTLTLATIENCYSAGDPDDITNTQGFEGGLVGYTLIANHPTNRTPYIIKNSFYNTDTTELTTPFGAFADPDSNITNAIGISQEEMRLSETYADWDFDTIWAIHPEINDGYPYLQEGIFDPTTGTEETVVEIIKPELYANYPNPFNPSTTISFTVGAGLAPAQVDAVDTRANARIAPANVTIDIYNIKGQKVRSLVNDTFAPGKHSVIWNGTDNNGRNVASGVYFYRMKTEGFIQTRKMILMK